MYYIQVKPYNCDTNTALNITGHALLYDQTYNQWHSAQLSNGTALFGVQGTYVEVYIVKTLPSPFPPSSSRFLDCLTLVYPDGYTVVNCMQSKNVTSTSVSNPTILNYCLTSIQTPPTNPNVDVIVFKDNNKDGTFNTGDTPFKNIYVTLRDTTNNNCISSLTDTAGKVSFACISGRNYQIYYTNQNITGIKDDAFFTNLKINPPIQDLIPNSRLNYILTASATKQTFNIAFAKYTSYPCKPVGYVIAGDPSSLYEVDLVTGGNTLIGPLGLTMNALAYNPSDNLLYAFDRPTSVLYRIEFGAVKSKVAITNIPNAGGNGYYLGTFDDKGIYYYKGDANIIYKLYLNQSSSKYGTIETISTVAMTIQDFIWHPIDNNLYSFEADTSNLANSKIIRINTTTGAKTSIPTDISPITGTNPNSYFMLVGFKDYAGYTYFMSATGIMYRAKGTFDNANNPVFAKLETFGPGFVTSNADGANCMFAQLFIDYGNAPENGSLFGCANYKSTLKNNGPRHSIVQNLSLGSIVLPEDDALDKFTDVVFDNDGPTQIPLAPYNIDDSSYLINLDVTNNTGKNANIYAWIDFNKDGIFNVNEATTMVIGSVPSGIQTIPLRFNKPAGVTLSEGKTFIRIRITTDTLTLINTSQTAEDSRSLGPASNGEVEDYILGIYAVPVINAEKLAPQQAKIGDNFIYKIIIKNTGSALAEDVLVKDVDIKNMIDYQTAQLLSTKLYLEDNTTPEDVVLNVDLVNGINIGNISPNSKKRLEFEMKVLTCTISIIQ